MFVPSDKMSLMSRKHIKNKSLIGIRHLHILLSKNKSVKYSNVVQCLKNTISWHKCLKKLLFIGIYIKKKHTVYLSEYVKSNSDSFGSKDIPASLIINLT